MKNDFSSLLLNLNQTNADWELILNMIESWHDLSPLDFRNPVGPHQLPLLPALICGNSQRSLPPKEVLEWFSSQTDIFEPFQRSNKKETLLDVYLSRLNRAFPSHHELLIPLVELAPEKLLHQWKGKLKNDSPDIEDHLLAWAFHVESFSDSGKSLVFALTQKGFKIDAPSLQHASLVHLISTPLQWQCAINEGVDFAQIVPFTNVDGQNSTQSLWQKLAKKSSELQQVAYRWAEENDLEQYQNFLLNNYWTGLDKGFWKQSDVVSALKAHPQWENLINHQGQSPLMVLSPKYAHQLNDIYKRVKVKNTLHHRDNEGRTLWYYLLQNFSFNMDPSVSASLLSHCPTSPSPITGQGFVAQLMEKEDDNIWNIDHKFLSKLAKKSSFEDWWASPEEKKPILIKKVYQWALQFDLACKQGQNLFSLLNIQASHIESPEMKGLALMTLNALGATIDHASVQLLMSEAIFTGLESKTLLNRLSPEIKSILEENTLLQDTQPAFISSSLRVRRM